MKKLLFLLVCSLLFVSCNYAEKQAKEKQQKTNDSIKKVNDAIKKVAFDSINKLKVDSTIKADSINKVAVENVRINNIRNSIRVTSCSLSEPNSAGGCDANFYYINKSGKTSLHKWVLHEP